MIIKASALKTEKRKNMRGGEGVVSLTLHADVSQIANCRLVADLEIPAGAGIGEHDHQNETEFYLIRSGEGIVCDDGEDKFISAGDVVITGGGASHNIRNNGTATLVLTAIIVTE